MKDEAKPLRYAIIYLVCLILSSLALRIPQDFNREEQVRIFSYYIIFLSAILTHYIWLVKFYFKSKKELGKEEQFLQKIRANPLNRYVEIADKELNLLWNSESAVTESTLARIRSRMLRQMEYKLEQYKFFDLVNRQNLMHYASISIEGEIQDLIRILDFAISNRERDVKKIDKIVSERLKSRFAALIFMEKNGISHVLGKLEKLDDEFSSDIKDAYKKANEIDKQLAIENFVRNQKNEKFEYSSVDEATELQLWNHELLAHYETMVGLVKQRISK